MTFHNGKCDDGFYGFEVFNCSHFLRLLWEIKKKHYTNWGIYIAIKKIIIIELNYFFKKIVNLHDAKIPSTKLIHHP